MDTSESPEKVVFWLEKVGISVTVLPGRSSISKNSKPHAISKPANFTSNAVELERNQNFAGSGETDSEMGQSQFVHTTESQRPFDESQTQTQLPNCDENAEISLPPDQPKTNPDATQNPKNVGPSFKTAPVIQNTVHNEVASQVTDSFGNNSTNASALVSTKRALDSNIQNSQPSTKKVILGSNITEPNYHLASTESQNVQPNSSSSLVQVPIAMKPPALVQMDPPDSSHRLDIFPTTIPTPPNSQRPATFVQKVEPADFRLNTSIDTSTNSAPRYEDHNTSSQDIKIDNNNKSHSINSNSTNPEINKCEKQLHSETADYLSFQQASQNMSIPISGPQNQATYVSDNSQINSLQDVLDPQTYQIYLDACRTLQSQVPDALGFPSQTTTPENYILRNSSTSDLIEETQVVDLANSIASTSKQNLQENHIFDSQQYLQSLDIDSVIQRAIDARLAKQFQSIELPLSQVYDIGNNFGSNMAPEPSFNTLVTPSYSKPICSLTNLSAPQPNYATHPSTLPQNSKNLNPNIQAFVSLDSNNHGGDEKSNLDTIANITKSSECSINIVHNTPTKPQAIAVSDGNTTSVVHSSNSPNTFLLQPTVPPNHPTNNLPIQSGTQPRNENKPGNKPGGLVQRMERFSSQQALHTEIRRTISQPPFLRLLIEVDKVWKDMADGV